MNTNLKKAIEFGGFALGVIATHFGAYYNIPNHISAAWNALAATSFLAAATAGTSLYNQKPQNLENDNSAKVILKKGDEMKTVNQELSKELNQQPGKKSDKSLKFIIANITLVAGLGSVGIALIFLTPAIFPIIVFSVLAASLLTANLAIGLSGKNQNINDKPLKPVLKKKGSKNQIPKKVTFRDDITNQPLESIKIFK